MKKKEKKKVKKQNKTEQIRKKEKKIFLEISDFGLRCLCEITKWNYLGVLSTLKFLYNSFGQRKLLPALWLILEFLKAFLQSKCKKLISSGLSLVSIIFFLSTCQSN